MLTIMDGTRATETKRKSDITEVVHIILHQITQNPTTHTLQKTKLVGTNIKLTKNREGDSSQAQPAILAQNIKNKTGQIEIGTRDITEHTEMITIVRHVQELKSGTLSSVEMADQFRWMIF